MRTIRVTSFLVLALLAAPAALLPHLVLPAAADGKEGPKIPDGMKGFSGMLEGKVVRTEELGFLLKVSAVVKEWKKNRAKDSKSAVGKELLVNAQWEKGDGGNWRPVSAHVAFFRTLKPGQELRIEVVNDEGERLHILELSKDQRAEAAKQDAKRAGGRDGDAKAENDREDAARENRGTDEPKEGDRPESDRDDGSLEKEPA